MAIDWNFINYRTADMNYYNNNANWWADQAANYSRTYDGINANLIKLREELKAAEKVRDMFPDLNKFDGEVKDSLKTLADRVNTAMADDGADAKIKDLSKDFKGFIDSGSSSINSIITEINNDITNQTNALNSARDSMNHANERAKTQRANAEQARREIWRERNAG